MRCILHFEWDTRMCCYYNSTVGRAKEEDILPERETGGRKDGRDEHMVCFAGYLDGCQ